MGAQQGTGYEDGVARMRRLLDQMSEEAAALGAPGGGRTATVAVAEAAPPAPPAATPGPGPAGGEAATAGPDASAAPRHAWWRRRGVGSVLAALAVVAISVVVWRIAGASLQGWVVGLGMDDERGALLGTLLVAAGAAALVVALGGAARAARLGGVVAMVAVEIVPFLLRGTHTHTTEGLTARIRLSGWILQPLGMLLLAVIAVSVGAALGQLLRSDVLGLIGVLRRHPRRSAGLGAFVLLTVVAAGPAMTAVQDGPLSALYDYGAPVAGSPAGPALAAGGILQQIAADQLPGRQRPGRLTSLTVEGRPVLVYVPGDYSVEQTRDFPVVYFLHGYPGNEDNWVGEGAQLPQVLDQLISSGDLPPTIAVMPNGNGQALSDAEWGNSQRGDHVEDWLVGKVVPEIDRRYRTLGTAFRGIGGLSSGGFGAVNLALRHPDVFRWAASYSGYFEARKDIFGPATPQNSPALVAPQLPQVARMPLFLGAGAGDRSYLNQQTAFARTLRALGWEPVHEEVVGGGHGWEAWRLEMVQSLEWLGGLWGSDPGTPSCRASCNG